jgi:benzodiazapine receptor
MQYCSRSILAAIMTTHIPSLTLPAFIFQKPAAAILLPLALGNAVGLSIAQTANRYKQLKQPPLNPPAWIFGPVWTCLYAAMGYASWRAYSTGINSFDPRIVELTKQGATLYSIQLGLNLIWTPLFFGLQRPIEATADILALVGTTGYLTYIWSQVDEVAAWALVPYMGWLGFATYLCVSPHQFITLNLHLLTRLE